jgi:hypothetical protein
LRRAAVAGALTLILALPGLAAARGPSTPAERKKAVETTRRLERYPLAPNADADRKWLLKWIVEIPDINVKSCNGPLDGLAQDEDGSRHGRWLYAQSMFGMTAFMIEHPREKGDWVAVQMAGVESTLRAYQALIATDREAHWDELDTLLEARRQGKLREVVEKTMEGCGEERGPGPGDAI